MEIRALVSCGGRGVAKLSGRILQVRIGIATGPRNGD
jgi:hypothetical protein